MSEGLQILELVPQVLVLALINRSCSHGCPSFNLEFHLLNRLHILKVKGFQPILIGALIVHGAGSR